MNGVVLAVDRQQIDAVCPRGGGDERPRHHQHFLVRERDALACRDRRQHGFERGCARRGAEHDVDIGVRRNIDEPRRTLAQLGDAFIDAVRAEGSSTAATEGHEAGPVLRRLTRERVGFCPAARATTRSRSGCASTTARALRPMDPVDPRIAMRVMTA